MSRPPNESADSAPEPIHGWKQEVLCRPALLSLAGAPWGDVTCLDVQGAHLFLAPVRAETLAPPGPVGPAQLRVNGTSGPLMVGGVAEGTATLRLNGVSHLVVRFRAEAERVQRFNRRQAYRVSVALRGEIVGLGSMGIPQAALEARTQLLAPVSHSRLSELARSLADQTRPCMVRDLSLGGARLSVASPAPAVGENSLLHLVLDPKEGETIRNLPCLVLHRKPGALPQPFDALVRVRFHSMLGPLEGRLGRYLTRVQLEQIRTGVKA